MDRIEKQIARLVIQGIEYMIAHKEVGWLEGRGAAPETLEAAAYEAIMYNDFDTIADIANDNQSLFPYDISADIDNAFMQL